MESHYARSKYKEKKFLENDLNIKQMYVLYCEKHASNPEMLVKEKYYRNVLHTDFPDLGFHKPKKDACNFCFSFGNTTDDEKAAKEAEFDEHHRRKLHVRELKLEHKNLAQQDPTVVAATFALEQALLWHARTE